MFINRKRILILVMPLAVLILLMLASFASAEGGETNPRFRHVMELENYSQQKGSGLHQAMEGDEFLHGDVIKAVTLTKTRTPTLDGKGKWSVTFNSDVYGSPLEATITLSMKDYTDRYTTVFSRDYSYLPSSVETCKIVTAGEYEFAVWVKSTRSGEGYYVGTETFTINDDASHTSLKEKISQVVSACRGANNWETALNLHEWLVTHVYYDLNYEYYGADMILRGYGVCDGYAKAYMMMLKKAGISAYRVTNASHAWNAVKLDGNWYYIDCTWDDPSGAATAVSGSERLTYFCLNTKLLKLDHPTPWEWTGTSNKTLTALDCNYYVYRKDWNGIGNRLRDTDTWQMTTYSDAIAARIANNLGGNYISFGDFYYLTDSGGWSVTYPLSDSIVRGWTLLAYAISKEPMEINGLDTKIRLEVTFSEKNKCFLYSIKGFDLVETGTLTLPGKLQTIEDEAFRYTQATTVVVPKGCTSIGKNAFADSSVHVITIPDSVTTIDPTAFRNCSPLLILCSGNCKAHDFARSKGILWHYP